MLLKLIKLPSAKQAEIEAILAQQIPEPNPNTPNGSISSSPKHPAG